jgi:hypothetical protein
MVNNLQLVAQDILGNQSNESLKVLNLQNLQEELKGKIRAKQPSPGRIEPAFPFTENVPITRVLPKEKDIFGMLAPEFRDATPVRDKIVNVAKSIMGIEPDTTISLFRTPEEELEIGQQNIFALPGTGKEVFDTFKPSLTLLGAPLTIPLNVFKGVLDDFRGESSQEEFNAIRRILALNTQEGDELFVADVLKEFVTDESAGLPEGTIDRIGLILDFKGFTTADKVARFMGRVITSKNPSATLVKELGDVARITKEVSTQTAKQLIEPIGRVTDEVIEFGAKFREETGAVRIGVGEGGLEGGQVAPTFFSRAVREVESPKFPNKIGGQQAINLLRKKIKPEELRWSGIEEWLKTKPSVTKKEIQDFLRTNEVKIEETTLIEGTKFGPDSNAGTSLVVPGGENYKELLLRLPEKEGNFNEIAKEVFGKPFNDLNVGQVKEVRNIASSERTLAGLRGETFRSTHFDEPNILSHVRHNDRVSSKGEKVLFIEEIQSDWALLGRKRGFRVSDKELTKLQNEHREVGLQLARKKIDFIRNLEKNRPLDVPLTQNRQFIFAESMLKRDDAEFARLLKREESLGIEIGQNLRAKAPEAPLLKNWWEFTLKRMLREAVNQGADRLAWITGKQTAKRYSVRDKVNRIDYTSNENGSYTLKVFPVEGGTNVLSMKNHAELETTVGKEIADRIINNKGRPDPDFPFGDAEFAGILEGEGLEVGGQWAFNLYDRTIPQFLNKFGKKFGAKVENVGISQPQPGFPYEIVDQQGKNFNSYAGLKQAKEELIELNDLSVAALNGQGLRNFKRPFVIFEKTPQIQQYQSIPITDAMKRSALTEGFELFSIAAGAGVGLFGLLGTGEAEAGVADTAKQILGAPIRGVKKLDPFRILPQKPIDKLANGFRIKELVKDRVINIDKAFLDSEVFIVEFERSLSPLEREALPFIRQGLDKESPLFIKKTLDKIGRDDLFDIIMSPSDKVVEFNERLGAYYDDAHAMLSQNFDEVGFVENYVTQIWDVPKGRKSEVVNYFTTHNPFLKMRKIPSLADGIKLGLKPKTLDIATLLRAYDQYKVKTVFNKQFAEGLKAMTDSETGLPLMLRVDKAPADWVSVDHPALMRAMAIGTIGEGGTVLKKVSVKVHPDIANAVKGVFSTPIRTPVISALETINAFAKKSMLSFSFFHHFALTESAFSSGLGKKALSLWNPYKVIKALKNKDFEIFKQMPLARDSIEHGVVYGSLPDFMVARVRQGLIAVENATKNIPVLGRTTKFARQANDLWDRALWDYYHNTLKLYAYEQSVIPALKRAEKISKKERGRSLNESEINTIKDEIGLFVNDSFGGQRWELQAFFNDAKNRQMIHWLLLSPDWTFSVLKQAFAPIKGHRLAVAGGSIEKKLAGTALSKRGQLFWARAIIYYNIVAQSANYTNTLRHTGVGRFTWDNAPGHKLDIFAGFNEDGSERYIRMGKQFREVMEWSYEPERKLGAKLGPVLRESIRQIAKVDPGSGFPTKFTDLAFFESLPERLKSVARSFVPFSFKSMVDDFSLRPFFFALPTSRGMTNAKTVREFKQAIQNGDIARIIEVATSALRNNLDADRLFTSANSFLKAEGTSERRKIAKKILKILSSFSPVDRKVIEQRYINDGIITPLIQKEFEKMKKSRARIRIQRKARGIPRGIQ